jgi:tRNA dimethylallyltransferase
MDLEAIFIAGPTAVGKSEVALLLAEQIGGGIISVDSMQVYRGMDIGTAKPSTDDRQRIPHHLIDIVECDRPFDAAQFVHHAKAAMDQIRSRNCVPVFCGGTGFYFKAFLEGLGEAPPASPELRAELEKLSTPELLAEIERVDPETFSRIDQKNRRRVIRAVEVMRLTGKAFSLQRANWTDTTRAMAAGLFIGLSRAPGDLRARIDLRVEEMFRLGLVAETAKLVEQGLEKNSAALQALGYRQVIEHLRGGTGLDATKELVKIRTRQFAKRQMTWFRRQHSIQWLALECDESPQVTVARIRASRPAAL